MANPQNRRLILVIAVTALATIAIAALLVNIFERKQEARNTFFRVVELNDDTEDPAVWGKNFPLQFDAYKRTVDQTRTRYGGSEAMRHLPADVDPRSVVAQSKLQDDPRLVTIWSGYAFATDFREERGHAWMLDDQRYTRRVTEFKQPGTCLNCHASTYVTMKKLGGGDIFKGFEQINKMTYMDATKQVKHPVACIDCHDPSNMALRVTRPAFIEGIRAYKASLGVNNFDPNKDATAQEMRSYVCGQCHVEYHFKGPEKRLTFPWSKGLKVDDALAYYDEIGFKDWVHKETGAPALKAQHPEFEMYNQGVHARSGVACADCHMPYKREGGMKISDHHVRSPMLNINRACQGCHHFEEQELKNRVEAIQARFANQRDAAMDAVVELINDIKSAQGKAPEGDLNMARDFQRKAQFLLDYVEAENSMGFHASAEALRILSDSINYVRQGQLAVRGVKPVPPTRPRIRVPGSERGPVEQLAPAAAPAGGGQKAAAADGKLRAAAR
ncbi:MAG TPA: ammonia-forming cytochrome c nitrite reductase subunit c552 [Bryobacteraceae bacterium]|nr:ammonia-forming cytochrome c nitrite reductase subunit c552 [Bryobacteraceae bacterium]